MSDTIEENVNELLRVRFGDLPKHCGNDGEPGIDEVEDWRDWSTFETTPDQRRIENFIDRYNLRNASILHIGVGNSELAKRFASRAKMIIGTTISPAELRQAERLDLKNYRVVLNNKYSGNPVPGPFYFDFIIDNNPTTFACCRDHLATMMAEYSRRLNSTGMIVTDRVGLGWVVSTPGANPRWKFSYNDWAAVGNACGLRPAQVDENVYVLTGRDAKIRRPIWCRTVSEMLRKFANMATPLGTARMGRGSRTETNANNS